jgi:hypothetical protein
MWKDPIWTYFKVNNEGPTFSGISVFLVANGLSELGNSHSEMGF